MQTIYLPVQPIKKAHATLEVLLTLIKILLAVTGYSPVLGVENQPGEANHGSL